MTKFLAVSNNVGDPTPYLAAEGARAAELQQAGVIEQFWVKADWSGAVMIINEVDRAAAQAAMDGFPLVINGITSFTLTEIVDPPPT